MAKTALAEKTEAPAEEGVSLASTRDLSFVGEEFISWLAFRVDTSGSRFELPEVGEIFAWIDDRILLRERGVENPAETSLRGGDPMRAKETLAALQGGKIFATAKLGIRKGDREWSFGVDSQLSVKGLKLPALMVDEEDEKFFERVALLEEFTFILDALFRDFCEIRFVPKWDQSVAPRLREWIQTGK